MLAVASGLFILIIIKCRTVVMLAFIALSVAYLLSPFVERLERKMARNLAIFLVYALAIFLTAGIIVLVLLPMFSELTRLPEYAYRLADAAGSISNRVSGMFGGKEIAEDFLASFQNALSAGARTLLSHALSLLSGTAAFLANALAALALSWFFLIDWEKMSLRMFLCVPSGIRSRTITALKTVRRELGGYLRAQSLLIFAIFIITGAVLLVTRVPMPVSLAVMYALLNAIPYFGPLIGTIPPVLAALTVSPVNALYTLGALLLIQQLDNYVLSPRIMGAAANSGPAAVLIAISAGGALFGVFGMFLALPALVTIKSVYRVFTAPKI